MMHAQQWEERPLTKRVATQERNEDVRPYEERLPPPVPSVPVTASIDAARRLVTLRFSGDTTYDEWKPVMDDVLANVNYVAGMCILSDRREAATVPSTEHIRALVDYLSRHAASFTGCGIALVARSDAEYGMSRMAEMLSEVTGVRVRAFRTPEDALAWFEEDAPQENGSHGGSV